MPLSTVRPPRAAQQDGGRRSPTLEKGEAPRAGELGDVGRRQAGLDRSAVQHVVPGTGGHRHAGARVRSQGDDDRDLIGPARERDRMGAGVERPVFEIVGFVKDAKYTDLREDFTLGYADARFAHGASSIVEWIDPSAAISGTDAYVTIGGGFWYASQLTIHHPLPWGKRRQEVVEVEREGNGYVPMLRAVTDAIRAGALEHPVHTAAATAEIYATCDEIRRQITA
jgi:hypothetical protein